MTHRAFRHLDLVPTSGPLTPQGKRTLAALLTEGQAEDVAHLEEAMGILWLHYCAENAASPKETSNRDDEPYQSVLKAWAPTANNHTHIPMDSLRKVWAPRAQAAAVAILEAARAEAARQMGGVQTSLLEDLVALDRLDEVGA